MQNNMKVAQKIKNRPTIWSSNSASEYTPKENENLISKRYMHSVFITVLFKTKDIERPKTHINGLINKKDLLHIHNGMFFSQENGSNPPIFNNMYEPWPHYTNEISQTEKRRIVWYHIYVESKKFKPVKNRVKNITRGCGDKWIRVMVFKGTNL